MPDVTDATPTEESVIPTDFTVFWSPRQANSCVASQDEAMVREITGSNGGKYEDYCFLGYSAT
jgi:hypothetical protein